MALATTAAIFQSVLSSLSDQATKEGSNLRVALRSIASYPLKSLAAFFFAPILVFRVIRKSDNKLRKWIACFGAALGLLVAYVSGTFLGTMGGVALIAGSFGVLTAFAFLIGTALSVIISLTFSYFVFSFTCFVFLKLSTEEVAEYLMEISS
ncbi:MAG: hypothetical protein ABJ308_10185 [Halieaceae bacterium]